MTSPALLVHPIVKDKTERDFLCGETEVYSLILRPSRLMFNQFLPVPLE